MSPHPNNFMALEPHLTACLTQALVGLQPGVHVFTESDLAGVQERAQVVPAVHVIYDGFTVAETAARGDRARLTHTWLIVAAVRNVAGGRGAAPARQEAGELLARAGAALAGAQLPGAVTPLRLSAAPRGATSQGFVYLPLAITVETVFGRQ